MRRPATKPLPRPAGLPKTFGSPQQARFVALLKTARLSAGLTQAVVAKRLGKPQSFVAKYEGSERRLDVLEFIAVAEALEVEPARIIRQLQALARRPT